MTVLHRQQPQPDGNRRPAERTGGVLGLVILLVAGSLVALALWQLFGPPQLVTAPDWAHVRRILAGAEVGDRDLLAAAATIAWLALAYLAATIVGRIALLCARQL